MAGGGPGGGEDVFSHPPIHSQSIQYTNCRNRSVLGLLTNQLNKRLKFKFGLGAIWNMFPFNLLFASGQSAEGEVNGPTNNK